MSGILEVAGVADFLDNAEDFYERADEESKQMALFIQRWWQRFGGIEVGVKDLYPLLNEDPIFDLGTGSDHSQKIRLGKKLAEARDRAFTIDIKKDKSLMLRVEQSDQEQHRAKLWRLKGECDECV